ncbi:hypothetical protein D9619_011691 [Psilocybe cf. subviscida]|uniref:Uncharacterized protein n=1 Tax=Psilocybe cf. subviscida TaxID=2480587 RepID=A0A8H5BUC2_9AGAR|nr:hypothetical protein D9619_011691 [Psilocybe cf. subviscida]
MATSQYQGDLAALPQFLQTKFPNFTPRDALDGVLLLSNYQGPDDQDSCTQFVDAEIAAYASANQCSKEEACEQLLEAIQTAGVLEVPASDVLGLKPGRNTIVWTSPLPNTDITMRMWPSNKAERLIAIDFLYTSTKKPILNPEELLHIFVLDSLSGEALLTVPSVEEVFMGKSSGGESPTFILREGSKGLLRMVHDKADIYNIDHNFTVPLHPLITRNEELQFVRTRA